VVNVTEEPGNDDVASPQEHWDARYGEREQIWSGEPNVALTQRAVLLSPGTALDLGCGEGADAIWLARRGWWVTGVDVSQVALDRAAGAARAAGVAGRTTWERHDLAVSFPAGTFDLVSAQYLHSFIDFPRDQVLRTASDAVAPGGTLLIGGHAGAVPSHGQVMPTTEEVLAALDLPGGAWEVVHDEEFQRPHVDHDGQPAVRTDNLLELRRLAA
jgi:SAM-dependent methyltransferase